MNIGFRNAEAVTPLHIAAWRGSPELVEVLLDVPDIVIDPLSMDEVCYTVL